MQTLSCAMRDLVTRPGIEPRPPALGAWSLSHWVIGEVPVTVLGFFLIFYLFIFYLTRSTLQHGLFSRCDVWEDVRSEKLLLFWSMEFRCTGFSSYVPWLYSTGTIVVAHRLSCSMARGIFPDQGLNPCPLCWHADSLPLSHQRGPCDCFLIIITLSSG